MLPGSSGPALLLSPKLAVQSGGDVQLQTLDVSMQQSVTDRVWVERLIISAARAVL